MFTSLCIILAAASIRSGLPANLTIDADLAEWSAPPSLTLGAADQVSGASKPSSPADLSAKIWLALGPQGLAIAGDITDDVVQFGNGGLAADHAELWLAFPAAPLPPLAFANQFGETPIAKAADCDALDNVDDSAPCKQWFAEQTKRRATLDRIFVRQYLITAPDGKAQLQEAWAQPALGGERPSHPVHRCCASSQVAVKVVPGGWRFEALIAPVDLPASAELPLASVRFLVDLADSDTGKLETFLSSSSKRKFGKPETFSVSALSPAITWESSPPILQSLLRSRKGLFFEAGSPVPAAFAFENIRVGYQYSPTMPSPSLVTIPLGTLEKVGRIGDVDVVRGPLAGGVALWAFRGNAELGHLSVEGTVVGTAERGGALHLLLSSEGTRSPLGTGSCGACATHDLSLVALDASGLFSTVLHASIAEDSPEDDGAGGSFEYSDVKPVFAKDLSGFGFAGSKTTDEELHMTPFKKGWHWDAPSKKYLAD